MLPRFHVFIQFNKTKLADFHSKEKQLMTAGCLFNVIKTHVYFKKVNQRYMKEYSALKLPSEWR